MHYSIIQIPAFHFKPMILISPNDYQFQKLLDIRGKYGERWGINFNPLKSNTIEFGDQFFDNSEFYLNNIIFPKVDLLKVQNRNSHYLFRTKILRKHVSCINSHSL